MQSIELDGTAAVRVIRVFLASPGDLGSERRAARGAVEEINRTVARPAGYHVDLVGWEDTLSAAGRPQAIINDELDTCHVFIGLIWQRWGTPPSIDGPYTSGFEEEYQRSRERLRQSGKPFMRLFFKDVDATKLDDAGPELTKVLDFKAAVIKEKAILFQSFDTTESFAQHVRLGLADYINRLEQMSQVEQKPSTDTPTRSPAPPDLGQSSGATASVGETALLEGIAEFLKSNEDVVDATRVARLRNLAFALGGSSNDTASLGAHDANLLYLAKSALDLSGREISALADAGLDALSHENVPLWSWLSNRLAEFPPWLALSTVVGPDERRLNAFKVMKMIGHKLDFTIDIIRESDLVGIWFSDTSDRYKIAALDYLADLGTSNEIALIRAELEKANYATRAPAQKALAGILSRENSLAAANFLIDTPHLAIDGASLEHLATLLTQLGSDRLQIALGSASTSIRRRAMQLLNERDALPDNVLRTLLDDAAVEIRAEALQWLELRGNTFTENEAETFLVRKKPQGILGIGRMQQEEGREALAEFKQRRLAVRSVAQLEQATQPFGLDEVYFALCRKQPKKRLDALRSSFDNRFSIFFEEYVGRIRAVYDAKDVSKVIDKLIADSETFWKRRWMRSALDILVSTKDKQDLDRVRKALDEDAVDPKNEDIKYFQSVGSLVDVARICKIDADYRSSSYVSTILGNSHDRRTAAKVILALAGQNLVNLLANDLPEDMIPRVIALSTVTSFKAITNSQLDALLYSGIDKIRKVTTLKMLVVNDKRSFMNAFEKYVSSDDSRFYNVIFWMDLRSAFPRDTVRKLAADELAKIE